jgi:hypothetical protein
VEIILGKSKQFEELVAIAMEEQVVVHEVEDQSTSQLYYYLIPFLITTSQLYSLVIYMDMKIHMLYNKIKVEIDINNDELLEIV